MAGDAPKGGRNYTPYQQKLIRRYYEHAPGLQQQRLAELVGELYLAEGKKKAQLWKRVAELLPKLGVHANRVDQLLRDRRPELLAELVKELEGRGSA